MPWRVCAQGPGDETSTATHAARASAQLRPLSLTAQTPRLPTRRGHAGCGVHGTERGGGRAEPGAQTPACPMTPPPPGVPCPSSFMTRCFVSTVSPSHHPGKAKQGGCCPAKREEMNYSVRRCVRHLTLIRTTREFRGAYGISREEICIGGRRKKERERDTRPRETQYMELGSYTPEMRLLILNHFD